MKLRIRGDSVRLRLSQGELGRFLNEGEVSDCVRFPNGGRLDYRLLRDTAAATVGADFEAGVVTVRVPDAVANRWSQPEEVGFGGSESLGADSLDILVEKDFACLAPRDGEDESDLFPNPQARA